MDTESLDCYKLESPTPMSMLSTRSPIPTPVRPRRARPGSDGLLASLHSLRTWDPWTNRRTSLRDRPHAPNAQTEVPTSEKAAGNVYDSMVRADRLATARASRGLTPGTNNNTNELEGGLKDVQQHTSVGGQRTIVITRLASECATGGSVVDVSFVIDSNSSNTPTTTNQKLVGTEDIFGPTRGLSNGQKSKSLPAGTRGRGGPGMNQTHGGQGMDQTHDGQGMDQTHGGPGGTLNGKQNYKVGHENAMNRQQKQALQQQQEQESEQSNLPPPSESHSSAEDDGETDTLPEEFEGEGTDEGHDIEDEEPLPQSETEKSNTMSAKRKLNISHLQKEGVIIGCMNVFADVMRKEFVVLLTDSVVAAFLLDTSIFRSVTKRTGCEIEVTRRILNRCIGRQRWVKYLVIVIKGPNMLAIDQCDRLMVKLFPPYKIRKEYLEPAHVVLFVKESYPDNSNMYFNFQRTGPTRKKIGDLRLRTPFMACSNRPLSVTPWKYANRRLFSGMMEPCNLPAEHVIQHVYPEWGMELSSHLKATDKWELAGDTALEMEKTKNLERSLRVKNRKMDAEPLFVENV